MSKVIIEAEGIKRDVPLPAAICLNRQQAYAIRDAMNQFLGEDGCTYGWVTIHTETVEQRANTKPLNWREPAI